MTSLATAIDRHFGSLRGAVRLALSHVEHRFGRAAPHDAALDRVRRLVFVCQGNICRSAFAEAVAKARGIEAISFGLATTAGLPAHDPIAAAAERLGYDIAAHRTTTVADYQPRPNDLLLAMEPRQMRRLAADPRLAAVPRCLLGLWAGAPHLHDPYGLGDAYVATCLRRIERAVNALADRLPRR